MGVSAVGPTMLEKRRVVSTMSGTLRQKPLQKFSISTRSRSVAIAPAAPQWVILGQERRVGGPGAIDGGAALEHHLAHARLGAGAQQLGRAHHVGVKGGLAAPGRVHKVQVADGVHPFSLEQIHHERIADVGQDEIEALDLFLAGCSPSRPMTWQFPPFTSRAATREPQ